MGQEFVFTEAPAIPFEKSVQRAEGVYAPDSVRVTVLSDRWSCVSGSSRREVSKGSGVPSVRVVGTGAGRDTCWGVDTPFGVGGASFYRGSTRPELVWQGGYGGRR